MTSAIETVQLTVPDISCAHCEKKIREEIGALPGVTEVAPSAATKLVVLSFNPASIDLETITSKLAEIDYPVAE